MRRSNRSAVDARQQRRDRRIRDLEREARGGNGGVGGGARPLAHVELEAYSVLTRLPDPLRADPGLVSEYLRDDFSGERMVLPEPECRTLIERLAGLSISGGAVYDASVAVTANHHKRTLLSCDRRAARTYDKLGIDVIYL